MSTTYVEELKVNKSDKIFHPSERRLRPVVGLLRQRGRLPRSIGLLNRGGLRQELQLRADRQVRESGRLHRRGDLRRQRDGKRFGESSKDLIEWNESRLGLERQARTQAWPT